MRIIYMYKALAVWGGIERILIDKMNYLANHYNYDIYMLTTDQGQHPIPYKMSERIVYKDLGIRFHTKYSLPKYKQPFEQIRLQHLFEKRLQDCLDNIKPDLIVSTADIYVNTINKLRGEIPYIVESHSMKSFTAVVPKPRIKFLYNYQRNKYLHSVKKASALVTLTQGDAKEWNDIRTDCHVIPNIVHLNPSDKLSETNNKRVIYVGRFACQKGIDKLLTIWEEVHSAHPDWQLDIYGEGEDKEKYMKEIDAHEDKLNIHVFTPTASIFDKYRESSIFILTSVYEPFGLVIPEAMSCGLPVVSFDCPYGPADIIHNGEDGFLIRQNDCKAFAGKVMELIEDTPLRKRMGKAAAINCQRYSPDNIMPLWKKLFESLTNQE